MSGFHFGVVRLEKANKSIRNIFVNFVLFIIIIIIKKVPGILDGVVVVERVDESEIEDDLVENGDEVFVSLDRHFVAGGFRRRRIEAQQLLLLGVSLVDQEVGDVLQKRVFRGGKPTAVVQSDDSAAVLAVLHVVYLEEIVPLVEVLDDFRR